MPSPGAAGKTTVALVGACILAGGELTYTAAEFAPPFNPAVLGDGLKDDARDGGTKAAVVETTLSPPDSDWACPY